MEKNENNDIEFPVKLRACLNIRGTTQVILEIQDIGDFYNQSRIKNNRDIQRREARMHPNAITQNYIQRFCATENK